MKTTKTTKLIYGYPGEGAVKFANELVNGLTREQARTIITRLLNGELPEVTNDKRVKRCVYCGYWWRDDSLRNTRKTCCKECDKHKKSLQRRKQRADKELLNPKPRKRTLMDDYIYWHEYPFWLNEYSMIKIGWKYEVPRGLNFLSFIEAKNATYGVGNRKKSRGFIEYHGNHMDEF